MLKKAFDYKKWADIRTLNAIAKVAGLEFKSSHDFVLQQINHMVIVEELFRARLTGDPVAHPATNSRLVPSFDELKNRLAASNDWYSEYVEGLEAEVSEGVLSFVFADGNPGSMSVEEVLFHIVNHGSYHRGSIAHALDLACVPHPIDGYGIYIHHAEPERRG